MILTVLEGILGFVFTIGTLIVLFGGFQWIMAKFFGTHFHGKYQARNALNEQMRYESAVQEYIKKNPALVDEAIKRCSKKGYSKTHYNILAEIRKIEKEKSGQPNLSTKVTNSIKELGNKVKTDNTKSDIEKLERLNKLKNEGGLTQEEFTKYKNQIINKNLQSDKAEKKIVIDNQADNKDDFAQRQKKREIQDAIKTINALYFEFQDEIEFLKEIDLAEIHALILQNGETVAIINGYKNLFELYSNDLITADEFKTKKKQILIKSIKTN